VLDELLGGSARPRVVGRHVILVRKRAEEPGNRQEKGILRGSVTDGNSRRPLPEVTVYDVASRKSALTDARGAFELALPSGPGPVGICFSKRGYGDTVVLADRGRIARIDLVLQPEESRIEPLMPYSGRIDFSPADSLGFVRWMVPQVTQINSQNMEDRTGSAFQVSLIPYIGTNWKMTGSVTNRYSLNVLAGYTGGCTGVEVGGLLNISKGHVSGVQVGGLVNLAGGRISGCQVAGLANYDLSAVGGVQVAGLLNVASDSLHGVQVAVLVGVLDGTARGAQLSGLLNVVTANNDGWQVAGLVNVARRHSNGVQIAGLFNYARMVHGLQLGLINVAHTVEKGVPVGLFSYVSTGYHLVEVSGNEIFYGNVAYKSGTRRFYTFFQAGMGSDVKIHLSYGAGTLFSLGKKVSLNIDLSAGFVYHPVDTVYHGLILKLMPAVEYRIARHFSVFAGPAGNYFLWPKGKPSATARGLSPYDLYSGSTANASIQVWIGGIAGVRF